MNGPEVVEPRLAVAVGVSGLPSLSWEKGTSACRKLQAAKGSL